MHKSKVTTLAPDQGNISRYDSDAERIAEAISRSLTDATAGAAEALRTRPDSSSLRSGGTTTMQITRSRSEERERHARSDDFRVSAQHATVEAEASQRIAQRSVRIDFDDDVINSAPLEDVLAAAELQIREQVNLRVAEVRARMEFTRKMQDEERRRQAAAVEAEVQRRVQQLLLADKAEVHSVAPASPTNIFIESKPASPCVVGETQPPSPLTPSVAALMASVAGVPVESGAAAAGDGENFAMKINQLQRYISQRSTAPASLPTTKNIVFTEALADGAVDQFTDFREHLLVALRIVGQVRFLQVSRLLSHTTKVERC
jgi:hypothetical protein